MASHNPLLRILDTNKLTGLNFEDWLRNLKIILTSENIDYILKEKEPVGEPIDEIDAETRVTWKKDDTKVRCYMLASMNNDLQKQHEHMTSAGAILLHLQELYGKQSRVERFKISRELFRARMTEGSSVHDHCLKMISYIETLESLGFSMDFELQIDLILQTLPDSFSQFVMNFQMNKLETSLSELLSMLVVAEENTKKNKGLAMVAERFVPKSQGKTKGKGKKAYKPKQASLKVKKKELKPKGKCFHCGKDGHWKRNCREFLADKKKVPSEGMTSLNVIETVLTVSNNSHWIIDSGASTHICNWLQDLREYRMLSEGMISLRMGNGAIVAAAAIGTFWIRLPTRNLLELKDCLYVPGIARNVISVSVLCRDGLFCNFAKDKCYIMNGESVLLCSGTMSNGLYVLNSNVELNHIEKPKRMNNGNSLDLWHKRMGHANTHRILKLADIGLVDPFDASSIPTCESCIMGKMTKPSFKGKGVRATELLGLIHSDVCGPMTPNARGGFSFFVTFIDDFSRYGYLYLMKYKSETFEKFKEFRSEVEKQTGKSIKCLRSD